MVWIYIAVIMIMRVVQSIYTKKSADLVPANSVCYLKYTALYMGAAGVMAAAVFCVGLALDDTVAAVGETVLYACISGAALAVGCMCTVYALGKGTLALNSMFTTAGILVPTVAGIFLYDENLRIWQWVALALFIVSALLLIANSKSVYGRFSLKTFAVLLLSFAANGLTMLMQKMFGMSAEQGNVALFSLISFAAGALLLLVPLGIILLLYKKRGEREEPEEKGFRLLPQTDEEMKVPKKAMLYGLVLAVAVFVINQLATMSTPLLPSVILFTFINGGAMIISAIVGAVAFREKLSFKSIAGVLLGGVALFLLQI